MSRNSDKSKHKKPYQPPKLIFQGHITEVTRKTGGFQDTGGQQWPSKSVTSGETP